MDEVLQANVFFFITSIAVIVFTIMLCVALYYIIQLVRRMQQIVDRVEASSEAANLLVKQILSSAQRTVERVEAESSAIAEDISNVRSRIAEGGLVTKIIGSLITARKRRRQSSRDDDRTEGHAL